MKKAIYFIHALSPLHPGTGQGVGIVDLPVARERATGLPLAPGSSIKGILRSRVPDGAGQVDIFGPVTEKASDHGGALLVGDARVFCLPVRSYYGTFAWVTSPTVLARLGRDWKTPASDFRALGADQMALPTFAQGTQSALIRPGTPQGRAKVMLEDLDLSVCTDQAATQATAAWATRIADAIFPANEATWKTLFIQRFGVVSDTFFSFLLETGMEINARIKIDQETNTAAGTALWYEESLPAETLLWGVMIADKPSSAGPGKVKDAQGVLTALTTHTHGHELQIGGKATVGKGRARMWLQEVGV